MNALYTLLTVLGALWALWYCYLIVMSLYRANLNGRLSNASKFLGAPALVIGWLLDWLINWTIATVFFREFPQSPMEVVTGRLSRYIAGPPCLNKHYAEVLCQHILDPFDPTGTHCK